MQWFTAKIIFQIAVAEQDTSDFDEQWILVEAATKEAAFQKAQFIAVNRQDCFLNIHEQEVQWKFINVAEIKQLHELNDGCELHSQINKYDHPELYINCVHGKAAQITNFNNPDWVQLL